MRAWCRAAPVRAAMCICWAPMPMGAICTARLSTACACPWASAWWPGASRWSRGRWSGCGGGWAGGWGEGKVEVIVALVAAQYAYFARTVHGAALAERQKEYIEAAAAI